MVKKVRDPDGTEHVELNKNEARQGLELYRMRYVLIFSTVGAVIALTAAYFYFFYFR